jgi:hypothetical protein
VAFGAFGVVAALASCDGESKSFRRDGSGDDTGAGEAGEAAGGESSGGAVATGGSGGRGGRGGGGMSAMGGTAGVLGGGGPTGGVGGSATGGSGGVPCGTFDCTRLPGVRAGAQVQCVDGICVVPADSCAEGFAHCSTNLNVGCEANLLSSEHCGNCETRCGGTTPECTLGPSGPRCSQGCEEPTPDKCRTLCTNYATDSANCGACGTDCSSGHAPGVCMNAACVRTGPCEVRWGDCNDGIGCESALTSPDNCGACGRNDCGAEGAVTECSSPAGCVPPTCIAGYANCDRASHDCEARTGAACFPTALPLLGLAALPTTPSSFAIAAGGAVYVAGGFGYSFDFDPSSGADEHTSVGYDDAYVTRFDANGAYAWTRTFGGAGQDGVQTVAVGRDGSLLVSGYFSGPADLDPGPGVDNHTAESAAFVSKLTAGGELVWARELTGNKSVSEVAGDAAGAVYAIGTYFLPASPSGVSAQAGEYGTFFVKFDASGTVVWDAPIEAEHPGEFTSLAVAADGSVWAAGRQTAPATLLGRSLGPESGNVLVGLEPTGTVRTLWSPGAQTDGTEYPFVAAGTNVHFKTAVGSSLDVDPGSATVTRTSRFVNVGSSVVVDLGTNGTYLSAHVFEEAVLDLQETPDGGALALVLVPSLSPNQIPDIVAYHADGTAAWSLRTTPGAVEFPRLAASSTHFAVLALEPEAAMAPSSDTGAKYPTVPVVRRYAF